MPAWLPSILVSIIVAVTTIAVQFYFKWVPDVDEQKRHVKHAWGWFLDFLNFGLLGLNIVMDAMRKEPVTQFFVVEVALNVGLAVLYLILFLYRRWSVERVDARHLSITGDIVKCLEILAKDENLSEETVGILCRKLYGKQLPPEQPANPLPPSH